MADPHHDAAGHHQRRGGEAELLGAEQHRDDHVAGGAHAAVALHGDPVPQPVEHQGLLGVGKADLPRGACVLERRQRRRAGAAVIAGDQHDVGVRLRHPRRDGADADRADQLDVDARVGVGVLQVVNELCQVLDRVDVVVRRRRDQSDAGRRMPGLRDVRVDLETRQLAALTRLGALRHLDLNVRRVHQVVTGDAESAGRHLLDGAAPARVIEPVDVLAALAGIGPPTEVVHRDRHGFVRLGRDGAVTHCAGVEPGDDRVDGLDLVERHRRAGGPSSNRTGHAACRPRGTAGRPRRSTAGRRRSARCGSNAAAGKRLRV